MSCDFYPPATRGGGPARSIQAVVLDEANLHQVSVVTRDRDLGSARFYEDEELRSRGPVVVTHNKPGLRSALVSLLTRGTNDVLYLNSIWSPLYTLLPLILWRLGELRAASVLIAPRGELSEAARGLKAWKKRPAGLLVRRLLSDRRVVWHATSKREVDDIRAFAGAVPVLHRANAWTAPDQSAGTGPDDVPTFVFVGRIVRIKNLLLAIEALKRVDGPVRLHVVGAPEDQLYWQECSKALRNMPPPIEVVVHGHLEPADVKAVLGRSHALLLPTASENFGHAIAEALASRCAVLIPDTTPWTPLVEAGAGQIFSLDPTAEASLASVLRKWAAFSPRELRDRADAAGSVYSEAYEEREDEATSLFETAHRLAQPSRE